MPDVATLISIAGAVGLGSLLTQYAGSSAQRRQFRADVLKALGEVESARWASDARTYLLFDEAMRGLETAALIARLPRGPVLHYKVLATAARWASDDDWDEPQHDDEHAGSIEGHFAALVSDAARDLTALIWSPRRARLTVRRRIEERVARFEDLPPSGGRSHLKNAVERIHS